MRGRIICRMWPPYFKAKKIADEAVRDDSDKERQLYDLRHEVIEAQIKHEAALKLVEEYKEQVSALQKRIVQLEAERDRKDMANRNIEILAPCGTPESSFEAALMQALMLYIWQETVWSKSLCREFLIMMDSFRAH